MTNTINSAETRLIHGLSPIEWNLLEAGEDMDRCIARTQSAAQYGESDPEYLICLELERCARARFKLAHRAAVKERRANGYDFGFEV